MTIKNVAVIGAGTMGNGIAHVFAQSGYATTLIDVDRARLDAAVGTIAKNLDRQIAKGALAADARDATLGRITTVTSVDDVGGADLAVEAVPELIELKTRVFTALDAALPPESILASNTSSISITRLAGLTKRS